jgi:hypothetical protein
METSNKFILASTLHDPNKRLINLLKKVSSEFGNIFSHKIVCHTPPTNKEIIHLLEDDDFLVCKSPSMRQVDTYKKALKNSIEQIQNPNNDKIFYSDFDRLLHWLDNYPNELQDLFYNYKNHEYFHIGRTKRAFASHPSTQIYTERIVNKIASEILKFSETKDIISVCYIITKRLAEKVLMVKNTTKTGFYGTWPVLYWKWAESKHYIEVEGLEWETADQFQAKIKSVGYDKWLSEFQSQEEWIKRTELLDDCLTELAELVRFEFKRTHL